MRKERLSYRELLRRLSSRGRLSPEERRIVLALLENPEAPDLAPRLGEVFESMARRGVLVRLARQTQDPPELRRFLDPGTNDRWSISAPTDAPAPAPAPAIPVVSAPGRPRPDKGEEALEPPHRPARAAPVEASREEREEPRPAPPRVEPPIPRLVQAIEVVYPEPGVARRFLDDSGEPLASFFSVIAARRATDELADCFEPIRRQIVSRTGATSVRLFLLDEDGRTLAPVALREQEPAPAHLLGNQLRTQVLGARQTLHVANLSAKGTGEDHASGALVSLPLAVGVRVAGVIEVQRETPGEFSAEEIDFFSLAAQVTAGLLVRAEHLEKLIFVDKLTSLYNRAYFDDQIEREIERANRTGTSVALLMADLDHFKRINDTFGHQAGDKALAHLASIIRANIRQIDVAARYGGEEFAILLPSITRARAVRTAERLRRVVADTNFSESIPEIEGMRLSISLGLALYPDDAATSKQLIDRADRVALYAAKNRGRNRVVSWAAAREGTESLKTSGQRSAEPPAVLEN